MFTGIVESLGKITHLEKEGSNVHIHIASSISDELKIDQSVAHNGVCLTVVALTEGTHVVTAVEETLQRTSLGAWKVGDEVNLERAMRYNARLDGHLVQGHVDTTGTCTKIEEVNGSWYFHFEYPAEEAYILVDKGSICVNGTSLTVINPTINSFSVAVIPYTFEHTIFKHLREGDSINLEFDILGKYIMQHAKLYGKG